MSQQQTQLRVYSNSKNDQGILSPYEILDLYGNIPIKINKSFAELQDISKRNSDYSIGLTLPGSKKNNRFFESFFNVDAQSLYFNATLRVNCDVLLDSQSYFRGYMRLNKVSVLNSKVEYDVTLYSTIGDLFGQIGNNLLKDLNFNDTDYTFNHTFNVAQVNSKFYLSNFFLNQEKPYPFFYPILHNGYNYIDYSGATLPNFTGATVDQTRLYTSTSPISGFTSISGATAAGVKEYYINSPTYGLRDNQLKPALSIYSLIQLIFKKYGYTIKSDFMNTPWMKTLYLYGYFSSEATKFSYKINNIEILPNSGVELIYSGSTSYGTPLNIIVCKRGTGVPCYSLEDISYAFANMFPYTERGTIPAGTSGLTINAVYGFDFGFESGGVPVADISTLRYTPKKIGDTVAFMDGDFVNFSLVIDQNIKQIDLLSSIAKKFDLLFIPDPDDPNQIIIEPFDFYMGTGNIYDWTPLMSWDKGFTVEPALNYIESELFLTDLEDGDEGNRIFKNVNNRIYGQNIVYNPTDFKSQQKTIDTIFSPELIRKWDANIGLPLGINYSASSEQSTYDNQVRWLYKGVKTKPKLFFWLGGQNPFIDSVNEVYNTTNAYNTYTVKLSSSTGNTYDFSNWVVPTISHTMPMGLNDNQKINDDSFCILFNSEQPTDTIGVQTYNTYTENDVYNKFYNNRITNLYNPNTRFLTGYFNLNYSDIQNLQPKDLIKINEQYFIVNKIVDFNLTNRELTQVQLLQYNVNTQEYVDRYFKYQYCDQLGYCFKLKTDFTNPNIRSTNFAWSIYYDHQVGALTGAKTGFTSTIENFNTGSFRNEYIPYTMNEITESEYISGSCIDWTCDTMRNKQYNNDPSGLLEVFRPFWVSSGYTGTNLWSSCSTFNTARTTYGIITGSSTTYGYNICIPTPTPTPTATNTPTPTMTPTNTPSITPTPSPTPTNTPSPTPTLVPESFKYVTAVDSYARTGIHYSSNSGVTCSLASYTTHVGWDIDFREIAMSWDGQYQMILPFAGTTNSIGIYNSSNYGANFNEDTTYTSKGWNAIGMSGNGKYSISIKGYVSPQYPLVIKNNNYNNPSNYSTDSLNGKVTGTSGSDTPLLCALSYDGSYQYIVMKSTSGTTYYYSMVSSNSGTTWTQYNNLPVVDPYLGYNHVVISKTGQYIYISSNIGIYKSSDFGVTFNNILAGNYFISSNYRNNIDCSADGSIIAIVDSGPYHQDVIISQDYGANFITTTLGTYDVGILPSVNVSSQGRQIYVSGNGIYWYSSNYGVTFNSTSFCYNSPLYTLFNKGYV
jgi:hypothetical protein